VFTWLHDVNVVAMSVVVFAVTFIICAAIFLVMRVIGGGERERAVKGVSPGMLPPMALVFGLLVGFLTAQVWSDADRAQLAVNEEASALRATDLLAETFAGAPAAKLRGYVRQQIENEVTQEWPAMEQQRASLTAAPAPLADALHFTLALNPQTAGQTLAQREIVASLQTALDARRQRIIVSESRVNWAKWTGVIVLAIITLVAIACVHWESRVTAAIAMGIFAAAVAVSIILIVAQDRPFSGQLGVSPDALEQVLPATG
jgi:hypothetical protein